MGTIETKTCDFCGRVAKPIGFTHELYAVDLQLKQATQPIWGNLEFAASFRGECCTECKQLIADKVTQAFVDASREAKAKANPPSLSMCLECGQPMKPPGVCKEPDRWDHASGC
jgi:hypothetical protein